MRCAPSRTAREGCCERGHHRYYCRQGLEGFSADGNPLRAGGRYCLWMEALSDESLLAGFASGDADAAAAFVRRFQSRVYGLALTMLRDRELADDAAQEAFVRAWRYAPSYDARRGAVATWLLAIARNVAIDVARVKPATPVDPDVVASELDLADHDATLDVAERESVRDAVASLPSEQRRALVLAVYAGRTAREISELDGVALGTVKTRIRSAMLKLRAMLEASHGL
jgi:RNA polymerase sigma factor (sigma-70 family)